MLEGNGIEKASLLYQQARRLIDQQEYTQAADILRQSWEHAEHEATAFWIGEIARLAGDPDGAFPWFRRAHLLNPKHSRYSVAYADSLIRRGLFAEAEAILKDAIRLNQSYRPAVVLLERARNGGNERASS